MRAVLACRRRSGIETGERRDIVGRELVRIRVAKRDRNAIHWVHVVHDGKAGDSRRAWAAGLPVITFRFNCDQPRPSTLPSTRTSRYSTSVSCEDCSAHWPLITTSAWRKFAVTREVIHAAVNCVPEALRGGAGACTEQRIRYRAVEVVDDSYRGLRGAGVMSAGAVTIPSESTAMLLPFTSSASSPAPALRRRPQWMTKSIAAKALATKALAAELRQDRAEVSLIGVIVHLAQRPSEGLAHGRGALK